MRLSSKNIYSEYFFATLERPFFFPIRKDHLGVSKRCNSIHPFLLNPPSQSTLSYSIHHLNPHFYFKLLNPLIRPQLNPPIPVRSTISIHPFLLNPTSQSLTQSHSQMVLPSFEFRGNSWLNHFLLVSQDSIKGIYRVNTKSLHAKSKFPGDLRKVPRDVAF